MAESAAEKEEKAELETKNFTFKCKIIENIYSMTLANSSTIEEAKSFLKSKAPELNGYSQKWIFQGRVLKDSDTLEVILINICIKIFE